MFVNKNLSWKIISGLMLAMGVLVSLLMVVFIYSNDVLEHDLMKKQNTAEFDRLKLELYHNPYYRLPQTEHLSIYLNDGDKTKLPEFLRPLPDDFSDELIVEQSAYFILVKKLDNKTVYIVNNISDFEQSEKTFSNIISFSWAVLMILIFAVSILLSRFLLKPISDFADEIETLRPEQRGLRLSGKYKGLEIEKMTNALDKYIKQLDEYVERQHSFAAMASHELRTPLTVVQTSSDLIASMTDNEQIISQCQKIDRSTSNMADMIHALLAITRDQIPVEECNYIALSSLIHDALEDRRQSIEVNNITIDNQLDFRINNIPDFDDTLQCHINLLSVVINNLLSNAIKHSSNGTIQIDYDNNTLMIKDTGPGLDSDNIDKLFKLGVAGKNKGGYGLGLYITKLICDKQGWGLILSNANPGTRAEVKL